LGSEESGDLDFVFSLATVDVEIFSFSLMVLVGFFLKIEGLALLIDLSLCEDTGFDFYLLIVIKIIFLRDLKFVIFGIFL
jgi:hypothetical protein